MARRETLKGDRLLAEWDVSAVPVSVPEISPPRSLSMDRSATPQGDEAAVLDAYSAETREPVCRRAGRLDAGYESPRRYVGVDRPSVEWAAEKEKAGSSFGSHDGRTVSGEDGLDVSSVRV
ncbi:hypothetical protein COL516b_011066 [Colletotrichum fioriniae]|nr:uncharacterized protein COL516b_011066 [Colletotrichum fioriniae]KAJ0297005.1 hypothetical protein COL516b_011066 [Colletotrichum fioriniae]